MDSTNKPVGLLSTFFDNATESVVVTNEKGLILYINSAFTHLLRLDKKTLIGESFERLLHKEDTGKWNGIFSDSLQREEPSFVASLRINTYKDTQIPFSAQVINKLSNPLVGAVIIYLKVNSPLDSEKEELVLSKANIKALLTTTPQAYFLLDPTYRILQFNDVSRQYIQRLWGKQVQVGDSMLDYSNPADTEYFKQNFSLALQGKNISFERNITYPNGQSIWYEIQYIPIHDAKEQVQGVVFTVFDITRRKEREDTLGKLSLVAQKTSNIVIITDKYGIIEWVNEGFTHITGYSLQEAQGKTPGALLQGPLSDKSTIAYMSECINKGQGFTVEIMNYHKDGKTYWAHISVSPVVDEKDELTGFIAIQSDITEKKALEEQMVQHLSTLNAILASAKDTICALDTNYRYITFNQAYANIIKNLYGLEVKEGMNALEITAHHGTDKQAIFKKYWDRALKGESFRVEEQVKNQVNETKYLEISYNPIYKEKDIITGVAIFVQDITYHKQTEQYLLRHNEDLRKINEQLDHFVYRAGHDLRAPLVSMLGLINIAQLDADALQKDKYMELMKKSIAKLDHFIQDIIYFSRNSRTEISYEQVYFKPLLEDILQSLAHVSEQTPIEHRLTIDQETIFYSDPKRLSVILNNLIANAIKYSNLHKGQPYLEIRVKVDREKASITVTDNGIGIAKEHIHRIFDMFYRATETKSGSGLGLAIVKETVHKLGGTITVSSTWGEGTSFMVIIPNRLS